jgi:hypothetical protein
VGIFNEAFGDYSRLQLEGAAMAASRRQFILAAGAAGLAARVRAAAASSQFTPEMFGARGDGRTNDTEAFAAMSEHVNARGGGTIVLRPVTYVIGAQHPVTGNANRSFKPSDIIHLSNCKSPISIRGNGAKLRCAAGLRFGRFDPQSGQPLPPPEARDLTNQAVPYFAMIHIENCSGAISISDIELDGNLPALWIGGPSGKSGGFQPGGTGIRLIQNTASETLTHIHSHHHPQDGIILSPTSHRTGATTVSDCVLEYNGRQGCSVTGGRNFVFQRCSFLHTGRAVIHSAPGAGVDIEAERPPIRNVAFTDCEFSDNHGFGLVSGSGDSADISCNGCKFIGTTNWSAWPDSPGVRFTSCLFVGSINHTHGDPDPARATQFIGCTFTDDPRQSPTGQVFLAKSNWIVVAPNNPNVLFKQCHFRLVADAVLPLSGPNVIYEDCDMSQRSPRLSAPRGTYLGTNSIVGNVRLEDSIIRGTVRLNGQPVGL